LSAIVPDPNIPIAETTWLEDVRHIQGQPMPDGQGRIILLTLANGHRYAIPLTGQVLRAVQQIVSPVTVAGSMPPNNSHGA
jgi:hypothetical protein